MKQICKYVLSYLIVVLSLCCMVFSPAYSYANDIVQNKTITVNGRVVDENDQPLAGAAIIIKGDTRGVTTDIKGDFSITVNSGATLQVEYLGYETQFVIITDNKFKTIKLQSSASAMEEVTVVAFAKQKKESVIGSVGTINPNELKVPSSNLTTSFAGRVAGMISYQRSGEPGQDNADFFIRGVTTFGYKVDPLILIDNIEMTSTDLARLNVDDIASFSIMKDATATALYGARGANGVILVTTKEGEEGKAKISLRYETSISTPTDQVDFADPITYMNMANDATISRDPLALLRYPQEKIDNTALGVNPYYYPAVDWKNMLLKDVAVTQRANLSISGGGKVSRYYVAASLSDEGGNLKDAGDNNFNNNINLKNYSIRANVNVNLTNTTEMIVRMHGQFADYTGPLNGGSAVYNQIVSSNPVLFPAYYPKTNENANIGHILFGNYGTGGYLNPYAEMVKGYKEYSRTTLSTQFEFKQNFDFITKGLSARAMVNLKRYAYADATRAYSPFYYQATNYDKYNNTYELLPLNDKTGTEYLNYSEGVKEVTASTYFEAALSYNRATNNKKHNFSGLLVFQANHNINTNAGSLQASLPYRNVGLSGRATYGYDNRYFFEANFGYNGSERFSANHRWGFFPSAGFGWMVSNEPYWSDTLKETISKLKIKGTYGLVGNDAIGSSRFLYLSEVNMNNGSYGYVFGPVSNRYTINGISLSRYANSQISWEVSKKSNIGFELELFNAVELQAEYYHEKRENILMARQDVPAGMGLMASTYANIGEAKGQGVDLSLDVNKAFSNGWWVQARANFTYSTSEYLVYEEPQYDDAPWLSRVGYPLSQKWGYLAENLFVDDVEVKNSPYQNFGDYIAGDIKYYDVNGDGQISSMDQVPIGYPQTPEIVYGFGVSFGKKNFDFSCFFQGLARESFWIDYGATTPFVSEHQLLQVYADSHWSEDNRDIYALHPRFSTTAISNNAQSSTWWMRDGSFLRLKSVELGYTIRVPEWRNARFRIYLSGTNLLTFSKFDLWDPEMAGNGLGYPIQRVFNIGVNINL